MHPMGKPKSAKLWKNSVTAEKKQKSSKKRYGKHEKNRSTVELVKAEDSMDLSNQQRNFKRKNQSVDFTPNKKRKPVTHDSGTDKSLKKIKEEQDDQLEQNIKLENASHSAKKTKPDNMTRKDWKMLHLDKKSKSPKESTQREPLPKGGWKELHMKEKGKTEIFEVGKTLKILWNELRHEDCKPERKNQLLKQVCEHLKGRVKEFTFAHDTVRVLECVLALGAETHRSLLFDELKDEFLPLAKSKYGKFFLIKMLKYGTKQHKDAIMKAFHGKIISLIKHSEAAEVLEFAFNECANATQRFEFIQEFFGATYKFFKVSDVRSLDQLIKANPEKKSAIIQNMKEALLKVLDKSVVKHSIVHHALWLFMKYADESSRSEIIESLKEIIPEILHTKDGSRVGMHCVWYGSNKDRKAIVKSMKRFVAKIAVEEHGHMVLLAIFDAVDDTLLVEKYIIRELVSNLLELCQNVYGIKVLIYLLSPRDPHYFHPDVINILKVGDNNETSKKEPEVRRCELKAIIAEPLLKLVKSHIQELCTNNAFCLFSSTVLQHADGDKKEAYEIIADLLVEPYTTENRNTHPVENSASSLMLKKLILHDRNTPDADCYFSEVLIDKVPKCVMSSWTECNRGAFLLVGLMETNIPSVVARVKEELQGRKKHLSKKEYKGANLLLMKLKE